MLASKSREGNQTTYKNNGFHKATRYVLFLMKLFGFLPCTGLMESSGEKLRFNLKSPYTIVLIVSVSGQLLSTVLTTLYSSSHTSPRVMYKSITYINSLLASIGFIHFSCSWPAVVAQVSALEGSIPMGRKRRLQTTVTLVTVLFCVVFQAIYMIEVWFYIELTTTCSNKNDIAKSYINYVLPWNQEYFGYRPAISWIFEVFHYQTKVLLNVPDLFIIVVAMYLTCCFDEFDKYVKRYKFQTNPRWDIIRMQYTNLCYAVKVVDKSLGYFVILSFSHNLLSVCVNLFKIIRKNMAHDLTNCTPEQTDYILSSRLRMCNFTFTICFLLLRILAVGLTAASVQYSARKPAKVLYDLKASKYNIHAKRFLEQIHTLSPSLSGHKFFIVSNGAILSMFASIVTYELVILQFSSLKL